jgi:uncharacterized repeat protein (TIGR02059 family)
MSMRKDLIVRAIILLIAITSSCRKIERVMMVSTGNAENVTINTAVITGKIIDEGEGAEGYGHCWSKVPGASCVNLMTEMKQPQGSFIYRSTLVALEPATKYYVRAYIRTGNQVTYGREISFTTLPAEPLCTGAVIQNGAPGVVEISFDIALSGIVPPVSAFQIMANSRMVSVTQVTVTGTRVFLNLAEAVNSGDTVKFTYTKPSSNPLQTSSGGLARGVSSMNVVNNVVPPPQAPVFIRVTIENQSPSKIEITYDLPLAAVIPDKSAFKITLNSETIAVSDVSIEANKVLLTINQPVAAGDLLTLSYIKPDVNPVQTPSGGTAGTLTAQNITNNVLPPPVIPPEKPVITGAFIDSDTPGLLKMSFSLPLSNIVPDASAFTVSVNSVTRTVSQVSVTEYRVLLNMSEPVSFGDVVNVSYTKPVNNPLQTPQGGTAETIINYAVINNAGPVCTGAQIENAAPSVIEITFTSLLADVVPDLSAFAVMVNSVARGINSISISGQKVLLTIATPASPGDNVTVSYTVPGSNPLQSASGKLVQTFIPRTVINKVFQSVPVFISAVVESYTPSIIEITYSLDLANIIPALTAFTVRVNSYARTISSVAVVGNKVKLVLSKSIRAGEIVTVSYTKPAVNAIQTPSGGQAESFSSKSVTNNVK